MWVCMCLRHILRLWPKGLCGAQMGLEVPACAGRRPALMLVMIMIIVISNCLAFRVETKHYL